MSKYILVTAIFAAFFFSSCTKSNPKTKTETIPNETAQMVGNDRDEHGCIASAGYVWSVVKNDCVRLFEADIKLGSSLESEHQNVFVALLFDDQKSKVEVFLANGKAILLSKKSEGIWADNAYEVQEKDGYKLLENGKEIFSTK